MANSDKNLVITPNIGSSGDDPKITFSGADSSLGAQSLNARIYPTSNGTLSFEGSAGQLFSITNSLTGTIFSVNDVSGLPSIEVLDTGVVRLARYGGRVLVGNIIDNGVDPLQFATGANATFGNVTTTNMFGTATADLYVRTPNTSTIGDNAKSLWFVAGDNTAGSGNAQGGRVIIYGGVGKGTSTGGSITLNSGASGSSSSTGSDVNIYGGDASAATTTGGRVLIQAGQTTSTATTSATGGPLYLFGGRFLSTTGTRVGGSVFIDAGSNGYNSTIGSESGNVNIGTSGSGFFGATTKAINIGSGTTITSISGNVGIATSSPATKLHVVGNTYRQNDATGSFGFTLNTTSATTTLATLFGGSSFAIQTAASGTNQLLLDASGNLGLGVTPSANDYTGAAQFKWIGHSVTPRAVDNFALTMNAYHSGGGWKYGNTSTASAYIQSGGGHNWLTAPSGTAGNAISFTQAMTLDANGRLGIGTTSPSTRLHVDGAANTVSVTVASISETASQINMGIGVITPGRPFIGTNTSSNPLEFGTRAETDLVFVTNGTEKMRLNSSGNLGFGGTTPGTWAAAAKAIEFAYPTFGMAGSGGAFVSFNARESSAGNFVYKSTDEASLLDFNTDGSFRFYNASSGTVGNAITFSQRMILNASGNLGVAVTPSTWSNDGNIQLKADRFISGGAGSIRIASNVYYDTDFRYIATGVATFYQQNAGVHSWHYKASGTGGTTFTPVEYARISTTGGFSVGTTSDPGAGAIYATGNITAYFSDERLKTKLGNIENALDKVSSISGFYHEANELAESLGYKKVREVGVSAQEVQKVMPEVVAPAPISDEYLTVRYERLVPLLIEAIKELKSELETLKKSINQNG